MSLGHTAGNKVLTICTNLLYGTALSDMETCYKCFRRDVIATMPLRSRRFEIEPELTAKILKARLRDLRGAHYLQWPRLPRGQEHDLARRLQRRAHTGEVPLCGLAPHTQRPAHLTVRAVTLRAAGLPRREINCFAPKRPCLPPRCIADSACHRRRLCAAAAASAQLPVARGRSYLQHVRRARSGATRGICTPGPTSRRSSCGCRRRRWRSLARMMPARVAEYLRGDGDHSTGGRGGATRLAGMGCASCCGRSLARGAQPVRHLLCAHGLYRYAAGLLGHARLRWGCAAAGWVRALRWVLRS